MTPRQSVQAECDRRGRDALVVGCVGLLDGEGDDDTLLLAATATKSSLSELSVPIRSLRAWQCSFLPKSMALATTGPGTGATRRRGLSTRHIWTSFWRTAS
jgi:hypothetical protein